MNPTTVLHIITRLDLGGAQQNTLDTCFGLDRKRFNVALMYGPGGPLDELALRLPPSEREIIGSLGRSVRPWRDAVAVSEMRARIGARLRHHIDRGGAPERFIVHTHSSKAGVLGRLAARSLGIQNLVHSVHGFSFHEGQAEPIRRAFIAAEQRCADWTRVFICVGRANLAEAQSRGIIRPHHQAVVIRSGMDLQPFRAAVEDRYPSRRVLGIPPQMPLFLSVANLKPQKDPLTLLEAFARVSRDEPRARLWFVGDGELRSSVERRIARHKLENRFVLMGWQTNVPQLMAASDVVVLASLFEGLPRVAVQAVAAERPFVGTRVDGTGEVIRHGVNGFLTEPRNPQRLAHFMLKALRERPVDPAPQARTAAWSLMNLIECQQEIYERLIRGERVPRRQMG
ncbi:MAG: glycosyltransferase [Myxococcota bacterium]